MIMSRKAKSITPSLQAALLPGRIAVLRTGHIPCRLFDNGRKICADPIGDAKQYFNFGISEFPVHKTQHGLRNPAALRNGIIRKLPALPFFSQQPDDFLTNRFIMGKPMHNPSVLQKRALDMYFSDVQYRVRHRDRNVAIFTKLTPLEG
jgi:hypothetical protein